MRWGRPVQNKKRIDPRYFLNETREWDRTKALVDAKYGSKTITSMTLDQALENYLRGWAQSGYGKFTTSTSVHDVEGGKSTLSPQLAKQYQGALEEKIGKGPRGQRRFLDRLVEKHWEKLLQSTEKISTLARTGSWAHSSSPPRQAEEPTFAEVLDVYEYHGGSREEYKHRMRLGLENILNKNPELVDRIRSTAQASTTKHAQTYDPHGYHKAGHGRPFDK